MQRKPPNSPMKKSRFDQAAFGATVATLRRASLVQGFRRPDQGFRRHAADIDAGSADGAAAERHPARLACRRDGGGETGRARPDDGEI